MMWHDFEFVQEILLTFFVFWKYKRQAAGASKFRKFTCKKQNPCSPKTDIEYPKSLQTQLRQNVVLVARAWTTRWSPDPRPPPMAACLPPSHLSLTSSSHLPSLLAAHPSFCFPSTTLSPICLPSSAGEGERRNFVAE
jgi:hypothetical protein